MTDDLAAPSTTPVCPWCSAALPATRVDRCPSCGATLNGDAEAPGLTTLDARNLIAPVPQRRSRLLAWITGEDDEAAEEHPAPPGSLEPPPPEVRREMLRMEIEAEVADLQAEAESLAAGAGEAGETEDAAELEAVADDAAALQADVAQDAPPTAPPPPAGEDARSS